MRTRYTHQVTTEALVILRKKSLSLTVDGASLSLEEWISVLSEQYATFKFWSLVLKYQRGTFLFIRAKQERKMIPPIELVHCSLLLTITTMRDGFDFFFKILRPCQKDLGQNSKWDASFLTEVAIVLPLYLLIMHMSR